MTDQWKPVLCLDFDGVIHDYKEGWKDGSIYGNVTPGFFDWATEAKEHFKLVIYSSRSKTPEGVAAMREWLTDKITAWQTGKWDVVTLGDFTFAHEKPPAFLQIDDRAITFNGDWKPLVPAMLRQFKPWNVRNG